ncbi:MAG: universal stress protein [Chloroflexota bacterium]
MYERIIVPLDGSKLAEAALPYAEELAAKMDSYISLLSVLVTDEVSEQQKYDAYLMKVAEVTRYHAQKYIGNEGGEGIKVLTVTRTGNPAEAIIEHASKVPFQLIVMASHGRSGLNRWAVGSVADKIVRADISQPVMLIRAKETRSDMREKRILKKALVPLDGSPGSEAVIPYISEMAAKLQMELTLLQIASAQNNRKGEVDKYLQDWCDHLGGEDIAVRYKVSAGSVADEIIDIADELAFDLVAMSTRGKTAVNLWSLGSVAQKVFLGGNTPLLLVKQ